MALKEWNLTENFNLEELNDNFSFLDEKIETTNSNLVDTNEELALKASQSDLSNLTTVVANHATYSTTEEILIGTYNGKHLYRKALIIPALGSVSGATSYAHGIANIGTILNGNASHATNGTSYVPIPYVSTAIVDQIGVLFNATNAIIVVGKNQSAYNATIFIEYTKTTD